MRWTGEWNLKLFLLYVPLLAPSLSLGTRHSWRWGGVLASVWRSRGSKGEEAWSKGPFLTFLYSFSLPLELGGFFSWQEYLVGKAGLKKTKTHSLPLCFLPFPHQSGNRKKPHHQHQQVSVFLLQKGLDFLYNQMWCFSDFLIMYSFLWI